jgi:hypothetical protein
MQVNPHLPSLVDSASPRSRGIRTRLHAGETMVP